MAAGRPSEYKEEYISKAKEYLSLCQDEYDEYHKTRGEKSDSFDRIIKVKLPTIEGFALYLDVSKKSLYNWAEQNPEFLHALDDIERIQKQRLIENGLSGDYNPMIAKLILSANHGMREKQDITTNNKDLPSPILGGTSLHALPSNNSTSEDTRPQEAP